MPLLAGPVLTGRVLGSHRAAVIIGVPVPTGQRVVSVLTPGATGVPNGVRLRDPADLTGIPAGTDVVIGRRGLDAGVLQVRIVRSWDSTVPVGRFAATRVMSLAQAAAAETPGVPAGAVEALRDALTDPSPQRLLWTAVDGLVGLGQGSTPGGDDVLAGVLAGLHATGSADLVGLIGARLDRLAVRTTALSADLLQLAVRGHACVEALEVLRRVGGSGTDASYAAAVRGLLSIGSTSGADLATGLALGLAVSRAVGPAAGASIDPRHRRVPTPTGAPPDFADQQGPR